MKKLAAIASLLVGMLLGTSPLVATAEPVPPARVAALCQHDGYLKYVRANNTHFANVEECVVYALETGTLRVEFPVMSVNGGEGTCFFLYDPLSLQVTEVGGYNSGSFAGRPLSTVECGIKDATDNDLARAVASPGETAIVSVMHLDIYGYWSNVSGRRAPSFPMNFFSLYFY